MINAQSSTPQVKKHHPTLLQAFIPIVFLILLLSVNVWIFGDMAIEGSNQIVLLLSAAVAGLVAIRVGLSWQEIEAGIVHSIKSSLSAILILLLIGALAGTWLLSGIVPLMIYYGLKILNPTIFLVAACIVSAVVSIATGSSWSTIATIGIALLGIGKALGISEAITAGAVISGAYFGDKVSPLSDTTNLAPAMAGTTLFVHIRYLLYTTVPSIVIALIIFLIIGLNLDTQAFKGDVDTVMLAIDRTFNTSPLLLLVPVIVIFLIIKKVPAIPALFTGALLGGVFALIFQPNIIAQVSGVSGNAYEASYVAVIKALYGTIQVPTGNATVDSLLKTNGMAGMLDTIWLIICAMIFGGIMERSGMLRRITEEVIRFAQSTGSLIASTAGTCIFFNITASDQYLAIVVPGRMYAETYRERNLKPENLSRTLEDAGTVTSVLVPWNTCGATQSSVLGVATMAYLPYCFFNLISPFMTILFGYLNIKIRRIKDEKAEKKDVAVETTS
ncbi:MAG: Na+/H+ antiporter NhaC [Thermonemataceae bacterium]